MEFLVDKNFCPLHNQQRYMWFAKMKDGSCIYEYDDRRESHWTDEFKDKYMEHTRNSIVKYAEEGKYLLATAVKDSSLISLKSLLDLTDAKEISQIKETLYDRVDKDEIQELGLVGCGSRVYFNRDNGTFRLSDLKTDVVLEIEGKKYILSGENKSVEYKRLHERHEMIYSFSMAGGSSSGSMAGMTVGYGGVVDNEDIKFRFDVLYTIASRGDIHTLRLIIIPNKSTKATIRLLQESSTIKGINRTQEVDLDANQENEFSISINQ